MKKSKTFLLLAILAAIVAVMAAFAWENWEPRISLAFLGMRSQFFPLAIWILLAVLAGILTAVIISSLFQLSNYLTKGHATTHRQEVPLEGTTVASRETKPTPEVESAAPSDDPSAKTGFFNFKKGSPGPPPDRSADDWADGPSNEENWGAEGRPAASPPGPSVIIKEKEKGEESHGRVDSDSVNTNPRNYEAEQEPKTESWSGSVYSYGYKDPSASGVGQSESVYDADYRIITPPPASGSSQTTTNPNVEAGGSNPPKSEQEREAD